MAESNAIREAAARARRLAQAVSDPEIQRRLLAYAEELETQAATPERAAPPTIQVQQQPQQQGPPPKEEEDGKDKP